MLKIVLNLFWRDTLRAFGELPSDIYQVKSLHLQKRNSIYLPRFFGEN